MVYLAVRAQSAVDLSSGNTSTAAVVDMVGVGASNTHPQLRSNASSTQPPLPSASPPIVDEMDIRSFVKIKRIPGGNPRDSFFIDGVVVSRQPIHRNFTRPIQHPRILMLACAIEYDARAGGSSSSISSSPSASAIQQRKYTSLEPLLSQETSHLKNTVARIMQLKPTLLLVGRTVARIALDAFIKAGVTVIVNVKMSALEDVSRCCGGAVVESIESLIMPPLQSSLSSSAYTFVSPQMGTCVLFECQTFVNDMIIHQEASVHVTSSFTGPLPPPPPNFRKTIMMFTQCPRRLGCTLVLRGGTFDDLAKVKPVLDMAVFAVRHLVNHSKSILFLSSLSSLSLLTHSKKVLETSLFMDSFARLPKVPYTTYLSELDLVHGVHSYMDLFESRHRQLSEITGKPAIDFAKSSIASAFRQAVLPYHHCVLSLSPAVNFGVPYLLQRVLEYVDTSSVSASSGVGGGVTTAPIATSASPSSTLPLLRLAKPSISTTSEHGNQQLEPFPQSSTAALTDIHELSLYSLETRAGIRHLLENEDITSPLGHQSLIVLYSNMSKSTNIPCQAPEVHMLDYYRESDTTLGQFLEDLCLNAAYLCPSKVCGLPMLVHYRSYAHGTGRVNVSITKEDEDAAVISAVSEGGLFFDATAITKFLNGAGGKCGIGSFQLDDRILMWSSCRKCASTFGFHSISPVAIMSEETWRISFGKCEFFFSKWPNSCNPLTTYFLHIRS